jgi:hypothetical protein
MKCLHVRSSTLRQRDERVNKTAMGGEPSSELGSAVERRVHDLDTVKVELD